MAFFSKPPPKKRPDPKPEVQSRPGSPAAFGHGVSARELALQAATKGPRRPAEPAGDVTVTGASLVQWAPGQSSFEVAQTNPGLCAVLENAALRYANAQAQEARALLEEGIAGDNDTRLSPLAWLGLFDLLQRDGDKAAFDKLSLDYVVQFERSAPVWHDKFNATAAPRTVSGYVAVTGRLCAASAKQLDGVKRAIANRAEATRLDLMSVQSFDEVGAQLLAEALAQARRARIGLRVQQGTKLPAALDDALKKGRDAGQGAWLLALELLQWANDRAKFEDRAVDFAVTFEVSPPSWEPPATVAGSRGADTPAGGSAGDGDGADPDMLQWTGVLVGSMAPQLGKFADSAHDKAVVPVDMSGVERIDFVCAGAFLNLISRIETQRKAVQIHGASPIIRALLLLLGVSPRHFVKKAE